MNEEEAAERPPVGPRSLRQKLWELRAPGEYASYVMAQPLMRRLYPAGERHAVLCLPAGMVGDGLTAKLRWGLRGHGYDAV
jgi:hypothetical protein